MIAENDAAMTDASECLFMLNTDNLAQKRAQARREYIIHEQAVQKKIEELTAENKNLSAENENLSAENKNLSAIIESLQAELAAYKAAEDGTRP